MTTARRNGTTRRAAKLRPILDVLGGIVVAQEKKYGPFDDDIAGVRLGLAVLQDELDEALEAWRDERRIDGWPHTSTEIAQVAAVAIRLLEAVEKSWP